MQSANKEMRSWLPRIGLQLSNCFERWFPDAFALVMVAVAIVFAACMANGSGVMQTAQWFRSGFWDLLKVPQFLGRRGLKAWTDHL